MNLNLVGNIYMYVRFCIKFPQSRMKGEPTEPLVLLAIVLSVLQFTDSDYPFGIFKFFSANL